MQTAGFGICHSAAKTAGLTGWLGALGIVVVLRAASIANSIAKSVISAAVFRIAANELVEQSRVGDGFRERDA